LRHAVKEPASVLTQALPEAEGGYSPMNRPYCRQVAFSRETQPSKNLRGGKFSDFAGSTGCVRPADESHHVSLALINLPGKLHAINSIAVRARIAWATGRFGL
jgi:hypothetical protein